MIIIKIKNNIFLCDMNAKTNLKNLNLEYFDKNSSLMNIKEIKFLIFNITYQTLI